MTEEKCNPKVILRCEEDKFSILNFEIIQSILGDQKAIKEGKLQVVLDKLSLGWFREIQYKVPVLSRDEVTYSIYSR
jgi:hypothetical protein